jgi:hypothetical protein
VIHAGSAVKRSDEREVVDGAIRVTAEEPVPNPTRQETSPAGGIEEPVPPMLEFVCSTFVEDAPLQENVIRFRIVEYETQAFSRVVGHQWAARSGSRSLGG